MLLVGFILFRVLNPQIKNGIDTPTFEIKKPTIQIDTTPTPCKNKEGIIIDCKG